MEASVVVRLSVSLKIQLILLQNEDVSSEILHQCLMEMEDRLTI